MNRALTYAVFVFLFLATNSEARDLKPFGRMDVFGLQWVSDPQISPDGRRIVYVRNSMDIMTDSKAGRLWLVNNDGTNNVPLTGRDIAESNAVWSPDGSRIAFSSKTDNGSEIFVFWLADGKIARLTQLERTPSA